MEGLSYTVGIVTSPAVWIVVVIIVAAWNNCAKECPVLGADGRDKTEWFCALNYLLHNDIVLEPYAIS
jgi:hypothetical protein